jgi:hypothetical protein
MPRSYIDIDKAKQALFQKKTESAIYQLPPGYIKGFYLERTDANQLIVNKGIANIRGKRYELRTQYIVNGEDFIQPGYILKRIFYYIYLSADGQFRMDSVSPVYDTDSFSWYHPTLYTHLYIGKFKIHTDGTYYDIFSYDPVVPGGLSTEVIQALFLLVSQAYIGYNGTGVNDSPSEGDRRIYIDNDEIGLEQFTNGGWTTMKGIKIGGAIAGLFLAMIGCTGIYHPGNPPTATEMLPFKDCLYFDFENDYLDQNGDDPWSTKSNTTFDTTYEKFGSYCFKASALSGYLQTAITFFNLGEDQAAGSWVYIDVDENASVNPLYTWYSDVNNSIVFDTLYHADYGIQVRVSVTAGGDSDVYFTTINGGLTNESHHYIGGVLDVSESTFYLVVDNAIYSMVYAGTWGAGTGFFKLHSRQKTTAAKYQTYIDELILRPDGYINPELLSQHYTNNVAWSLAYNWADILIRPYLGGWIYHDGDTYHNGNTQIAGNLSVDGMTRIRAYKTVAQDNIPTNTPTKILYNFEEEDNLGEFSGSRFTATIEGWYDVHAEWQVNSIAAAKHIACSVYKNDVPYATDIHGTGGGGNYSASVSCKVYLEVGDYIEIYGVHGHGANRNTTNSSTANFVEIIAEP